MMTPAHVPSAIMLRHARSIACLTLIASLGGQALAAPLTAVAAASAASATVAATAGASAAQPAVQALINQARHWQQRGRADLATESWRKLLAVDPRQPEALQGLAQLAIDARRFDEAATHVERLRSAHPTHPALSRLEQQVQRRDTSSALVAQARQLASTGQTEAATKAYQSAFGSGTPSDDLAMEYYQTLGGTRDGWDGARAGLERLAREQPDAPAPALAYATHLSYREATRRDAIERLAALSTRSNVPDETRQEARAAWRQALLWLNVRPTDARLLRQYLDRVGDNAEIRARLQTPAQPAERTLTKREQELQQAYAALNTGQLGTAEQRFNELLQRHPGDSDMLAGLGIVRMRQERFGDAASLLEQAAARPDGGRWKSLRQTARHWQWLTEARAARDQNRLDEAERLARQSVEAQPQEPEALTLLGDVLVARRQPDAAEQQYRKVLQAAPNHTGARLGLIALLDERGQTTQAQAEIARLDPNELARMGGPQGLRASQMRRQAEQLDRQGDVSGARALLEQAISTAPELPWARLDLGRLLLRQGWPAAARAQADAISVPSERPAEALHARALLLSELKDTDAALQSLDTIAPASRTADMAALYTRLSMQAQIDQATALHRNGRTTQARRLMQDVEQAAGGDPALLGTVADGYTALGDSARADRLLRAALARQPAGNGSVALQLRQAALLLRTGQDRELAEALRSLSTRPLDRSQQKDFAELRLGLAIRQADQMRERGELAAGWEALEPLLQSSPGEPRLQMALARLHSAANQHSDAAHLYQQILEKHPDNVDAWLGLSGTLDAQRLHDGAAQALKEAQRLAPDQPAVLAQYGRHYRAKGEFTRAAEYLRAAATAERPDQGPGPRNGSAAATGAPLNPFAGRQDESRQALLVGTRPRAGGDAPLAADLVLPGERTGNITGSTTDTAAASTSASDEPQDDTPMQRAKRWWPATGPAGTGRPATARNTASKATGSGNDPQAPAGEPRPTMVAERPPRVPARPNPLANELAELRAEQPHTQFMLGGQLRTRRGEGGLGRLTTAQTPVEARIAIEDTGQLVLRAIPVFLDAGELGNSADTRARFGTLGLEGTTGTTQVAHQSASGVGFAVGMQTSRVSADIGTTPQGFEFVDVVGGVRYADQFGDDKNFSLDVSRRAVTDSLVSFAGTTDNRIGQSWGGVRATGARAQVGWEQDGVGLYGYGSFHLLDGHNVLDNQRVEAGVGGYWQGWKQERNKMEVGLNLGFMHYAHNQRGFTWGHGGYFSPQQMISLSMPAQWSGRNERLQWNVQTTVSIQTYREDAAPYFPTDQASQSALEALAAQGLATQTKYDARSSVGFGFNLGGGFEYRIGPQLDLGARLNLEQAPQHTQAGGSLYVRFTLEPRGTNPNPRIQMSEGPTGY